MMLPKMGDSLSGRLEIFNLWPLSQDEIIGRRSEFLDSFVNQKKFNPRTLDWKTISSKMMIGGYPEALHRPSLSRRDKWFGSYLTSILQKDIRDLSNIEGLNELPNLLKLIATRVGSTINFSDISRLSGIKNTTLKRYISLLEHTFIIIKIPAWTKNAEGQIVKSSKVYLNDTGLLNYLRVDGTLEKRNSAGASLENFVVMEIIKQLSWSDIDLKPYHFSIHKGSEVDMILEERNGDLYGIEIKSTATLQKKDFSGLERFSQLVGNKFKRGIVLYTGEQYLGGFGKNLQAVPISAVWEC